MAAHGDLIRAISGASRCRCSSCRRIGRRRKEERTYGQVLGMVQSLLGCWTDCFCVELRDLTS